MNEKKYSAKRQLNVKKLSEQKRKNVRQELVVYVIRRCLRIYCLQLCNVVPQSLIGETDGCQAAAVPSQSVKPTTLSICWNIKIDQNDAPVFIGFHRHCMPLWGQGRRRFVAEVPKPQRRRQRVVWLRLWRRQNGVCGSHWPRSGKRTFRGRRQQVGFWSRRSNVDQETSNWPKFSTPFLIKKYKLLMNFYVDCWHQRFWDLPSGVWRDSEVHPCCQLQQRLLRSVSSPWRRIYRWPGLCRRVRQRIRRRSRPTNESSCSRRHPVQEFQLRDRFGKRQSLDLPGGSRFGQDEENGQRFSPTRSRSEACGRRSRPESGLRSLRIGAFDLHVQHWSGNWVLEWNRQFPDPGQEHWVWWNWLWRTWHFPSSRNRLRNPTSSQQKMAVRQPSEHRSNHWVSRGRRRVFETFPGVK